MVLFVMLCEVVLPFQSLDEMLINILGLFK